MIFFASPLGLTAAVSPSLLAFWLVQQGPYDVAELWTELSASQRSQIKAEYKAAGITLAVSAFGSTDTPTTDGYDPVDLANRLSAFVKDYDLDGVDIDYEVRILRLLGFHRSIDDNHKGLRCGQQWEI